jgi:hypothetical protein
MRFAWLVGALIYYSAAPWDGAAYELQIPLEKTDAAPNPTIRVNIWGNPEFAKSKTITFSGREDAGGGKNKGIGRASYQPVFNESPPEALSGSITFKSLKPEQDVEAAYKLKTSTGRTFKGTFKAKWGNKGSDPRGGAARRQ